ncbi:MAG: hypothetical protein P1V20_24775 [Verrucomicrobiales bacterium]|nr:hypothetical protein [Verrucomicrobiales bacterium]
MVLLNFLFDFGLDDPDRFNDPENVSESAICGEDDLGTDAVFLSGELSANGSLIENESSSERVKELAAGNLAVE